MGTLGNWYTLNPDKTVSLLPEGVYPSMSDEDKRVGWDETENGTVSTVFLALDHSFDVRTYPILFETMIFGGPHDNSQWRWVTWHEAKMFHDIIVNALKEGKNPEEVINSIYDNRN